MQQKHRCPNGHPVVRGQKYCPECGAAIDWSTDGPQQPVEKPGPPKGWGIGTILAAFVLIIMLISLFSQWSPETGEETRTYSTSVPGLIARPSAPRATSTPALTLFDLERESSTGVTYEKLARSPETYEKARNPIKLQGEVVQIVEQSEELRLRVNITQTSYGWKDDVVVYREKPLGSRLLEGDVLVFYAWPRGLTSYETVLGTNREVPLLELYAIWSTN